MEHTGYSDAVTELSNAAGTQNLLVKIKANGYNILGVV